MKRCPQCNRIETDDALVFCRTDGAALVSDSRSLPSEAGTTRFGTAPTEIETSILPHATEPNVGRSTGPTTVLPPMPAASDTRKLVKPKRKWAAFALVTVVAAALAVGGYFYTTRKTGSTIQSIAVMPFVNESGNADVEYLSDGMTETLINSLSQIPNLSVKARSSVFRYKGKELDPKKIAAELNVQAILTGRVVQRGDQITLNLELIDARTENVLWGNRYERKSSQLVALQSEVARDASSKLKSKLTSADTAKIEKEYTASPEAYQLYLKGRFHWNKRSGDSLKQSVEFYRRAIETDPNYALAYSSLAETYVLFPLYSIAIPIDSMPLAKAAAMRALEIDDSLAQAHAALGSYLTYYEHDRAGAEKEYRRAIELNPNYATAHQWLGNNVLNPTKRFEEGLEALRRAEELDPLSPIIGTNVGDSFVYTRQYDDAISQYQRVLLLDPNFAFARFALGWAYYSKGSYPEAIAELRKSLELSYDPTTKGWLGLALAKAGQREEAIKLLNELKQESSRRYVMSSAIAIIYVGLNEKDEALNWLEKEVAERSSYATFFAVDPVYDDLRGEPRFAAMLKRLNLPE